MLNIYIIYFKIISMSLLERLFTNLEMNIETKISAFLTLRLINNISLFFYLIFLIKKNLFLSIRKNLPISL